MFQRLQENPTINGIMCVPYSNLMLNDNTRQRCMDVLGNNIPNEAVIVYSPSDDGIVVLGYYVLDTLNMSQSIYFEVLREATLQYEGFDPRQNVEGSNCIHISDWVFDESLRDRIRLQHIFLTVTSSIEDTINHYFVWCDSSNEDILFYPIKRVRNRLANTSAILYFSHMFLYEQ